VRRKDDPRRLQLGEVRVSVIPCSFAVVSSGEQPDSPRFPVQPRSAAVPTAVEREGLDLREQRPDGFLSFTARGCALDQSGQQACRILVGELGSRTVLRPLREAKVVAETARGASGVDRGLINHEDEPTCPG